MIGFGNGRVASINPDGLRADLHDITMFRGDTSSVCSTVTNETSIRIILEGEMHRTWRDVENIGSGGHKGVPVGQKLLNGVLYLFR